MLKGLKYSSWDTFINGGLSSCRIDSYCLCHHPLLTTIDSASHYQTCSSNTPCFIWYYLWPAQLQAKICTTLTQWIPDDANTTTMCNTFIPINNRPLVSDFSGSFNRNAGFLLSTLYPKNVCKVPIILWQDKYLNISLAHVDNNTQKWLPGCCTSIRMVTHIMLWYVVSHNTLQMILYFGSVDASTQIKLISGVQYHVP